MKRTAKILLFILFPFLIQASPIKGKYTKEKNIHKTFTVANDALLKINNQYGNIDIVTWDKNETVIDVTIKADGDNEDAVIKRLNDVSISFNSSLHQVLAKTIIKSQSNNWRFWESTKNTAIEVHYQIKMPVNNSVQLTNDYGGISINRLKGSCVINCDYGAINIGELLHEHNKITMDYASKSNIEYIKKGIINVDYSSLHIETSENIKITADYSHLSFGNIDNLDYNCDYGSLKIDNVTNLTGTSDYMQVSIENINTNGILNSDYGSIKIKNIKTGFNTIRIQSEYTNIKIGTHQDNQFNTKIRLEYGQLKYDNTYTFPIEKIDNSDKYYEGFYNAKNTKSNLIINSEYGNVKLK